EQAGRNRLLRQHGEIANAELLRLAAPHARRIDALEYVPRPERRQRPSRTRLLHRLRAAWGYRHDRLPAEPLPLERIGPDHVIGFSHQRSLLVESLREADRNGAEPGDRRARPRTGRSRRRASRRNGPGAEQRERRERAADETTGAAENTGRQRRGGRRRKKKPATASAEAAVESAASEPADQGEDAA